MRSGAARGGCLVERAREAGHPPGMTSLHARSLASTLLVALALAGCPGTTTTDDAGPPPLDALASPDSPLPADDAAVEDACWCTGDAPPPIDAARADVGPVNDAGPVLGDSLIANDCGPADGLALRLTISAFLELASCSADPTRASTAFYIHDLGGATLPPTAGTTITSTTASSSGTASSCPGGSPPCRVTEDWTLTFDTYATDGGATGQYMIRWVGGEVSTGTFDATRCSTGPLMCG